MKIATDDFARALAPFLAASRGFNRTAATLSIKTEGGVRCALKGRLPALMTRWEYECACEGDLDVTIVANFSEDILAAASGDGFAALEVAEVPDCGKTLTVSGPGTGDRFPVDPHPDTAEDVAHPRAYAVAATKDVFDVLSRARMCTDATDERPSLTYVALAVIDPDGQGGPAGEVRVTTSDGKIALFVRPGWDTLWPPGVVRVPGAVECRVHRDAVKVVLAARGLLGDTVRLELSPEHAVMFCGLDGSVTIEDHEPADGWGLLRGCIDIERMTASAAAKDGSLTCVLDLAAVGKMPDHPGYIKASKREKPNPHRVALVLRADDAIVAAPWYPDEPLNKKATKEVGLWHQDGFRGDFQVDKHSACVVVDSKVAARADRALGGTARDKRNGTVAWPRYWSKPFTFVRGTAKVLMMGMTRYDCPNLAKSAGKLAGLAPDKEA